MKYNKLYKSSPRALAWATNHRQPALTLFINHKSVYTNLRSSKPITSQLFLSLQTLKIWLPMRRLPSSFFPFFFFGAFLCFFFIESYFVLGVGMWDNLVSLIMFSLEVATNYFSPQLGWKGSRRDKKRTRQYNIMNFKYRTSIIYTHIQSGTLAEQHSKSQATHKKTPLTSITLSRSHRFQSPHWPWPCPHSL